MKIAPSVRLDCCLVSLRSRAGLGRNNSIPAAVLHAGQYLLQSARRSSGRAGPLLRAGCLGGAGRGGTRAAPGGPPAVCGARCRAARLTPAGADSLHPPVAP